MQRIIIIAIITAAALALLDGCASRGARVVRPGELPPGWEAWPPNPNGGSGAPEGNR